MLKGYKTYVTAALAVLTALAAWAVGDASVPDTAQAVLTALMVIFMRSGLGAQLSK